VSLDDYDRKRDFEQTAEPGPALKSSPGGDLFVIQKHAAKRLHYDVRLELGGTLKSWAVPKGPSLDPQDKHLAVHVEDHPLDYAGFEGTIPQGQYGAGTVMVWDRGRWFPEGEAIKDPAAAYREGKLKFRLEGEKLHGRWMLLRLKPRPGDHAENWLLFKERDDEAREGAEAVITVARPDSVLSGRSLEQIAAGVAAGSGGDGGPPAPPAAHIDLADMPGARPAALPARLAPQLATLATEAPSGDDWLHEIKYDGYRVMGKLEEGTARLLTRRGADWTSHFPSLLGAVERIPVRSAILDGEVVFVQPDGRTSFPKLASALQSGADAEGDIVYYVFDLLYLDGYDLTGAPLHRRKEALRRLLAASPPDARVRYVEHVQGLGEEFFQGTCEFALEGEIAKRRDAPYRPGRGRDWLKVKCTRRQEFVIGGFTERAGGRRGIGALLLGHHEEAGGPLHYAGRVGTGWDERTMTELRGRLDELRQEAAPFVDAPEGKAAAGVTWVDAELVGEVEYLSWDGRGAFRHSSFKGLRLDKPASEVVVEQAIPPAPQPAALSGASPETAPPRGVKRVTVGGIAISNPERIMYPELGLTKLDLARYYEEVAAWMLPHISRRPLTLVRCPEGHGNECFFQRHAVNSFPASILRVPIAEADGVAPLVAIDSATGLLSLVQMGVLEFHVWGSHIETVEYPDQIVFDLDPDVALPFARVIQGARLMHDLLEGLGLRSFVKTTGGKGLHVVAPLLPTRPWDEVKAFTKAVAEMLARFDPASFTTTMSLKRREGRIYVDYLRNGRSATSISAYSTRRRPVAPVSAPLRWDELGPGMSPERYTVTNMRERLAQLAEDPWQGYDDVRQEITSAMLRAVRGPGDAGG
jgi:bifunctional non-homologous end joining protein LigD